MNTRRTLKVGGALALCLILGVLLSRPSAGQQVTVPPAGAGRYQVVVKGSDNISTVFVFDSTTGQCWHRSTHANVNQWTDMGTPAR